MVTIKNGKQVWKISEDEYNENKAKWNARGEVEFDVKDPMLEKPEYDLQTEVEIKPKKQLIEIMKEIDKKDAKKKAKQ